MSFTLSPNTYISCKTNQKNRKYLIAQSFIIHKNTNLWGWKLRSICVVAQIEISSVLVDIHEYSVNCFRDDLGYVFLHCFPPSLKLPPLPPKKVKRKRQVWQNLHTFFGHVSWKAVTSCVLWSFTFRQHDSGAVWNQTRKHSHKNIYCHTW